MPFPETDNRHALFLTFFKNMAVFLGPLRQCGDEWRRPPYFLGSRSSQRDGLTAMAVSRPEGRVASSVGWLPSAGKGV